MSFPITRPRRLRRSQALRDMIAEFSLSTDDLMYPIFVVHGSNVKKRNSKYAKSISLVS